MCRPRPSSLQEMQSGAGAGRDERDAGGGERVGDAPEGRQGRLFHVRPATSTKTQDINTDPKLPGRCY
ncbi:hypothetical protein C0J52_27711 [Blattella germanica]|nr:hypothetical protein C0J52_27711 [Blattella germanica]